MAVTMTSVALLQAMLTSLPADEYAATSLRLRMEYHHLQRHNNIIDGSDEEEESMGSSIGSNGDDDSVFGVFSKKRRIDHDVSSHGCSSFVTCSRLDTTCSESCSSSSSTHNEYTALLKFRRDNVDSCDPEDTKKNRVFFRDTVNVKEIPSHRDVCPEVRQAIWTSLRDIQRNAERNELEFVADGEDFRTCTEEDQFCEWQDEGSGATELVHPYTFENLTRKRQEEDLLLQQATQETRGSKRDNAGAPLRRIPKVSSLQDLSKHPVALVPTLS